MSAFVLSGAKRTYLLAKISSNLRLLKLERRRARNIEELDFFLLPAPAAQFNLWPKHIWP
jgi:hypothetical protein